MLLVHNPLIYSNKKVKETILKLEKKMIKLEYY